MHDGADGVVFTVLPIVFGVLVFVGMFTILVCFIVTLYNRWRQYVNQMNGRGSGGGNFFIVVDQDHRFHNICGTDNFLARGGGLQLIESTAEEEVMK